MSILAPLRSYAGKDRLFAIWKRLRGNACEAWQDFAVFEAWSLANGYAGQPALDLDGDEYSPETCRWCAQSPAPVLTHQHRLYAA